jgi:hypothetical protein
MHQEMRREYGRAGASSAHQQRRAAAWHTSAGDFIDTGDVGPRFGWRIHDGRSDGLHLSFL